MSRRIASLTLTLLSLLSLLSGLAHAQPRLGGLIGDTERALRGRAPDRFAKIGELIEAGAESPEASRELAAYARAASPDVLELYLSFAIDLGLTTREAYGRFLAGLMSHREPAIRERAFALAIEAGGLTDAEDLRTMIDAMSGYLALAPNEARLVTALGYVASADERFARLLPRLVDLRRHHPSPRVVAAAANALYAVRGGGDPRGSLRKTLRALSLDVGDRVARLCELMLYRPAR